MDGDDNNSNPSALLAEEVSTLRALYGDENIILSKRSDGSHTHIVSINLRPHLQTDNIVGDVTLSTSIPSNYPDALPQTPSLAISRISASRAAELVQCMLERAAVSKGSQCLFDYCQNMLDTLQEFADSQLSQPCAQDSPQLNRESLQIDQSIGTQSKIQNETLSINVIHCSPVTEHKSVFQAHVSQLLSEDDLPAFLSSVRESRKGHLATHTMFAYRLRRNDGVMLNSFDDDGEKGGGKCMLNILIATDAVNVVVAVTRWFGGIKLGPARFRIIAHVTRDAIDVYRASTTSDPHKVIRN